MDGIGNGNGNKNFPNSATNGDDVQPSVSTTEIEIRRSTKPKDTNDSVNSDDVNLMTRETADGVVISSDLTHSGRPPKTGKPTAYSARKTAAQGMMDIALLTSNANQLRNLIAYQKDPVTFYVIMVLIIASLVLQITVGIFLIFKGRFDTKGKDKTAAARVNNQIMAAVFLITIINIFIAVFSIPEMTPTPLNPNLNGI